MLHTFVVNASTNGYSRDFIVQAKDEEVAVANLLRNAELFMAEIKKTMAPDDLKTQVINTQDEKKMEKADELVQRISEMTTRIDELGERDDDFANVTRETLVETIADHREEIQKLRESQEETIPSKFDRMTKRVAELKTLTLKATRLDPNRCYSVAYFDDSRDYYSAVC